jgi:hypothetical protein
LGQFPPLPARPTPLSPLHAVQPTTPLRSAHRRCPARDSTVPNPSLQLDPRRHVAPNCQSSYRSNSARAFSSGDDPWAPLSHPALRNKARCISYIRQGDNIYNNRVYRDKCHKNQSIYYIPEVLLQNKR